MSDWFEKAEDMQHVEELLTDDYYTIGVRFPGSAKSYTYKVPNEVELTEEDFVVVDTAGGLQVVKVVCIHEEPNINFQSSIVYKYIVQKVDMTTYNERVERAKKIETTVTELMRRKLKKELLGEFIRELPEGSSDALKALGVTVE